MADIDWARVLQERPDVAAEYQNEATRDRKSRANLDRLGIDNAQEFAQWWYNNSRVQAGDPYVYTPPAPVAPPVETPPPATYTPPVAATPPPEPTRTDGTPPVGGGATTTPGGNRDAAYQQALLRARLTFINQGLNPDDYMGEIGGYLSDIYNLIPAGDTNAGSYFDPNIAQNFLNGRQAQQRTQSRNFARQAISRPSLDYTSLDGTISKLLESGLKEGTDYLTRGKTRGQFNEAGYAAGQSKLQAAKTKASAKLRGYANDIFGKYDSQYGDIYSRAMTAANNSGNEAFDITPFAREFERVQERTKPELLEGELLSTVGEQPLVDLSSLRSGVALGQGTTNLKDLDILDGLAKRKQANAGGRGLGSQGAF